MSCYEAHTDRYWQVESLAEDHDQNPSGTAEPKDLAPRFHFVPCTVSVCPLPLRRRGKGVAHTQTALERTGKMFGGKVCD